MAKDYWGLSSNPEADDDPHAAASQPESVPQHDQSALPPKPADEPGHDQSQPDSPAPARKDLWAEATDITDPAHEEALPAENAQQDQGSWPTADPVVDEAPAEVAPETETAPEPAGEAEPATETEALPLIDELASSDSADEPAVVDAPADDAEATETTVVEEDATEQAETAPEEPEAAAAPKRRRNSLSRRKKAKTQVPEGAKKAKTTQKTAIGPTFEVPRPGGRLRGGRRRHRGLTSAVFFSVIALFAICLIAFTAAILVPKDVEADLSAQEKQDLRLDNYPTDAAAAFAVRYATECLSFDSAEDTNREERRSRLAGFATSGVDQDCGWNGQGKQTVVGTPFWDGTSSPVEEWPENARWLGIQATVSTNEGPRHTVSLAVPVYTDDPSTGEKFKVVGEVGQVPLSAQAEVPAREKPKIDADLSRQLQDDLISPYFTAWAASDDNVLSRYTAPNASDTARTGLSGASGEPKVTLVSVYVPADASGDSYSWQVGDTAQADVTIDWASGETTLSQSYRVTLTRADTGWFIQDVKGATVDPSGSEE